jgi:transcriptional regulator with XRE-family HTH domain
MTSPDGTIGDRLAEIRRRRSLTQEQLAEAAGVSVETIRKLEQNERTAARVATLNKLARALDVRTSSLFGNSGQPVAGRDVDDDDVALVALRRVLAPARGIRGATIATAESEPASLGGVQRTIWAVDRAYHADDYASALTALPTLLTDAALTAGSAGEGERPAALRALSQAEQLAGTMLIQTRKFDLAHRALDRALDAAGEAGDELVAAAAVVSLCWLLPRQGRLDEAEELAVSTADAIEPSFARASPEHFATWGWLMLRGAAAAVRNNRDDRAGEMLDAAAAAGARVATVAGSVVTPAPATVGTFGPATVAMKRVETAIVAGDTGRALRLAQRVPAGERPTSNNRNRHLLDVAYAQADNRLYAEATATLERIRHDAPIWLRHQRYARDIVANVVASRRRALSDELNNLVAAVGLEL